MNRHVQLRVVGDASGLERVVVVKGPSPVEYALLLHCDAGRVLDECFQIQDAKFWMHLLI